MSRLEMADITVVRAFIPNALDDSYLLLRRTPEHKNNANLWELPGGRLDKGETHEDALRREVLQEIGHEIQSFKFDEHPIEDRTMRDQERYGQRYVSYVARVALLDYDCPIVLGHDENGVYEHSDKMWQRFMSPLEVEVTGSTPAAVSRYVNHYDFGRKPH